MSESNRESVDAEQVNETNYGKYWAALRDTSVVGLISMRAPGDVDFNAFSQKAKECLELLGQVKSGDVIERNGQRFFVQRQTHANRSSKPRPPKEFLISQHSV